MIKRRFYKLDHGDQDASDPSSSSSDSELEAEATEESEDDTIPEVKQDDEAGSTSSGYKSEDSSANDVDVNSSGLPFGEDDVGTINGKQTLINRELSSKHDSEVLESKSYVLAEKESLPADMPPLILKCKSVFKCRICPRIICLTEDTLRDHLRSKKRNSSSSSKLARTAETDMSKRERDVFVQTSIMVLMFSVKNACYFGWFQIEEREELVANANEIGKTYNDGDAKRSYCHYTISAVMERFYQKMKLGQILASVEVSPGYATFAIDFIIVKNSPPPADQFETGPQMPTNVTGMLHYGTNLLQVVGQFDGHYVILASMSVTSLPEDLILEGYIQPDVTPVDSDFEIEEGPSLISLNCPISFGRIKTPVKGWSCKHLPQRARAHLSKWHKKIAYHG